MPIGSAYLSRYTLAEVWAPEGMGGSTLSRGDLTRIAYKQFSKRLQTSAKPLPLVQGWPLSKIMSIQPSATWVYDITLPIIIEGSSTSGIRSAEIEFWNAWQRYLMSSYEQVTETDHIVVEKMGVSVNAQEISLSLTIRSTSDIDWLDRYTWDEYIMGRTATNYDTFVRYSGIDQINPPQSVWENRYPIESVSLNFSSDIETMSLTMHSENKASDDNYYQSADRLNLISVSYAGDLTVLNPSRSTDPISLQYAAPSISSGSTYTAVDGEFVRTPQTEGMDKVFTMDMTDGGIQIYVGEFDGISVYDARLITALPKGLVIHEGSRELSAGQLIKEKRSFYGILSTPPEISGLGPEAWVADV